MLRAWVRMGVGASLSVGLHLGVAGQLSRLNSSPETTGLTAVEMFTVVTPPPKPEPVPAPEKPKPEPPAPVTPRPVAQLRAPETKPAPPPDLDPPSSELTGSTLVGSGDGSWSTSALGNGLASTGPIVVPRERPQPRPTAVAAPPPEPRRPVIVPLNRLSRKPRPPALDQRLLANYPSAAKSAGIAGHALVAARIDPDGRVKQASVLSDSGAGFGEACRRTVVGSIWQPPLGADGHPVATVVRYRCRFEVNR